MKNRFVFIILIFFSFEGSVFSQPSMTNVWYFGAHAGLKFVGGNPVALSNGQINNGEGCSVECDNYGDLLFYTDGVSVWNKNHVTMPNGTGLNGNTSSTQMVIVRKPGNCMQFYIFYHSGQNDLQLYYSIVDMTLNGGLGDVVVSSKNTFIYYPATEKITAVNHQNGVDVWVLFHEYNTNKFMAYLVTTTGINSPVNTNVGPAHTNMIGYMKASHNGSKLASAISFTPDIRAELYNFDNATGIVSNPVLFNNWSGAYGLEFSPNDSILYVATFWGTNHLYQIDLTNNSFQSISSASTGNYNYCALQLGPDGKIYMARSNLNYISVINNPNVLGTGCNFVSNGFTLAPGTFSASGLPTFHQSLLNFHSNHFTYNQVGCSTYNFLTTTYSAYDSLNWNFGDIPSGINNFSNILNPQHTFSSTGNYYVTLIIYNKCYIDTLQQIINVSAIGTPVNLGNDTSICTGSQVIFDAGVGYASYIWNTGATSSSIIATSTGTYAVTVTNNSGCQGTDIINLLVHSNPVINLGNDTTICSGNQFIINAGSGYYSYNWNTGSISSSITTSTAGSYSVSVSNSFGCMASDAIDITLSSNPTVNIGPDQTLCNGQITNLNAGYGYSSYLWQDGTTSQTYSVNTQGSYWVQVTNSSGCKGSDTVHISVIASPLVDIGNDTALCPGSSITLDAGNLGSTYLWSNGSTNQTNMVSSSGSYWVSVSNGFCSTTDTIQLSFQPISVNLGNDTVFCGLTSYNLNAGHPGCSILWSTGDTTQTISISNSGTYWVSVNNSICNGNDTINITFKLFPVISLGNDTTLCQGNSIILDAGNVGSAYLWSTGATSQTIFVTNSGEYLVTVNNGFCTISDTIQVGYNPFNVLLGNDTILCGVAAFSLDAGNPGSSYLWSTGDTVQMIVVHSSGSYWVSVSNSTCSGSDTVDIILNSAPIIALGQDTSFCPESMIVLDAGNSGASFLWSTGSTNQSISVSSPGTYWVNVTNGNCSGYDTINVSAIPPLDLGRDISLCNKSEIILSTDHNASSYLWSTGSASSSITIDEPGEYWLIVTTDKCTLSDSINITGGDVTLYIPNAFTPDNDGKNEIFKPVGDGILNYNLKIFTGWGEMMFESTDINKGWDGRYKGNLVEIGVYVWVLDYGTICTGNRDLRKYGFVLLMK